MLNCSTAHFRESAEWGFEDKMIFDEGELKEELDKTLLSLKMRLQDYKELGGFHARAKKRWKTADQGGVGRA